MSKKIYKLTLQVTDYQEVKMPAYANILSVQNQNGVLTLWYIHDDTKPLATQGIQIFGTGHTLPHDMSMLVHIGTVQMSAFVWHVFIIRPN